MENVETKQCGRVHSFMRSRQVAVLIGMAWTLAIIGAILYEHFAR